MTPDEVVADEIARNGPLANPADDYHDRIVRRQIQRCRDEIEFLMKLITDPLAKGKE